MPLHQLSGVTTPGHGGIALDALGQIVVAARTTTSDLPVVDPLQPQTASPSLFKISSNGLDRTPLVPHPGLVENTLASGSDGTLYLRSSTTNSAMAPVSKSTDGGTTWTIVANGIVGADLTVDPNNSSILYTISQKSSDGGATWISFPAKASVPVVRPGASNVLFALRNTLTDPAGAVMKSVDGGVTWNSSSVGITDTLLDGI